MPAKPAKKPSTDTRLTQYQNTYSYQELLKKHSLDDTGIWRIRGEDPNCDFGGHHYQPDLGTYEGRLEDVIRYAVGIPNFWTWGAGGDIVQERAPIKIDATSTARRAEAEQKVQALEAQLANAREELKGL